MQASVTAVLWTMRLVHDDAIFPRASPSRDSRRGTGLRARRPPEVGVQSAPPYSIMVSEAGETGGRVRVARGVAEGVVLAVKDRVGPR